MAGWPNRDLNVGAIIALAPDLSVIAKLLSSDQATVRKLLNSWGPGKFDAELLLDGKAFNPQQVTDGVVTGRNVPGAGGREGLLIICPQWVKNLSNACRTSF